MSMLPSYRNQSIDLHSKLIDWFLYEGNTCIWWFKEEFQKKEIVNGISYESVRKGQIGKQQELVRSKYLFTHVKWFVKIYQS